MARSLQRFNPWPIVLYHAQANRRSRDEKATVPELILLYGAPSITAATFVIFQFRLGGVAQLLAATSLLVGAMISVFVFLANLRVKVFEVAMLRVRRDLKKLIASSAVGALYVSMLSMVLALVLALMASIPALIEETFVASLASASAIWLLVHLVVSLASVLRRLFGIYTALFGGDFSADVDSDAAAG
ncbi:hypothetical protein JOF41_006349 [Saccharothrix coeruleofusca]|uniref:hypothetical protein n=1 Tax=Saccharothrix coeruleofusca TaxID=33919 RepID=UPI001AE831EC|nr:hypothetical protein [Saccharothrix coeruleofusca]MBP2340171.1 hypothetical protein [Saccharothrix coeruleofusca]